jgi:Concanavalin A-like lectin/glucanases superfamily
MSRRPFTGGGGYLAATWYFADAAVDLDFSNNRYFVPGSSTDANLVLLAHMDGTDTAQVFPDATGRHAIIANGNAQIDNAQSKFGGTSALFDGAGDYLTTDGVTNSSDFAFGTGDFTIDFWARTPIGPTNKTMFATSNAPGNDIFLGFDGGGAFKYNVNGGATNILTGPGLAVDTWTHYAIVRSSGTSTLFVNGTSTASGADTTNFPANYLIVGIAGDLSFGPWNGWIEELRIRRDAAWTSSFTPSASAYSDPAPTGPYFALSCSRASTGYAKTSAGTLTSFAANTLRRTDLGSLVEDARTNVFPNSQAMSTWFNSFGLTSNADNQAVAPDGTTTANKILEDSTSAPHATHHWGAGNTNEWVISVYVKAGTRTFAAFSFAATDVMTIVINLLTGAITDTNGSGCTSSVESLADGWWRISMTGTGQSGDIRLYLGMATSATPSYAALGFTNMPTYTGAGTGYIYAWGAQCEEATFPSSYIPTTSASATRAADAVTIGGAAQTTIAAATGSIVAQTGTAAGTSFAANIVDSNGTNVLGFDATNHALASLVATLATSNTANRSTTDDKLGLAWSGAGRSLILNGATVVTDASAQTPSSTQRLGSANGTSNFIYAYVKRLTLWSSKLADATLQSRTAP